MRMVIVPKLTVNGNGEVSVPPDLVTIVLGVETKNTSSDAAAAENAILMNRTIKALLLAGLREDQIETSQYRLTMPSESEELIKAIAGVEQPMEYTAISRVTVSTNASEDVGKILGAAIKAGSNSVKSVSYSLKDSEQQRDEALAKAVADARHKADIIASSAGVQIIRVLNIDQGNRYYGGVAEAAVFEAEDMTSSISIPLQPRNVTVQASISIVYQISEPVSWRLLGKSSLFFAPWYHLNGYGQWQADSQTLYRPILAFICETSASIRTSLSFRSSFRSERSSLTSLMISSLASSIFSAINSLEDVIFWAISWVDS